MNYDNYYKNGGMTKEESVSAIALRIGAKKEAVAKFVEKHKIDTNQLNSDLKSGEVYFMDVITAIVGKPDNKYEKEIVKKYGSKMAMGGRTQGYNDREDERLGMKYGKMSGKDFDGSHDMREHSRRDDARFEERMAKGGEFRANNSSLLRYANFDDDSHINLVRLNPIKTSGLPYKNINKFAVSVVSHEDGQKVMQFKTLDRAESKFEELVDHTKRKVGLRNEGKTRNYSDSYADGGMMADGGVIGNGKNGYVAFYKGKKIGVHADTMYEAQKIGAKYFNAKKEYEVNVVLAEIDGKQYFQSTIFGDGGDVEGFSVGDRVIYKNGKYPFTIVEVVDDENLPYANIKDYDGKIKKAYLSDLVKVKLMMAEEYVNTDLMNRMREGKMADGGMMADGGEIPNSVSEYENKVSMYYAKMEEAERNYMDDDGASYHKAIEDRDNYILNTKKALYQALSEAEENNDSDRYKMLLKMINDAGLYRYAKGGMMADGGYVIFEGQDHYNNKPLYQVISKDEDNDYVGEFHDNREDAEKELNELKNKNMHYDNGGMMANGGNTSDESNLQKEILSAMSRSSVSNEIDPKIIQSGKSFEDILETISYEYSENEKEKRRVKSAIGRLISKGYLKKGGLGYTRTSEGRKYLLNSSFGFAKGGMMADGGSTNKFYVMQDTKGFIEQGFWGVINADNNELIDIFEFKKEANGFAKQLNEIGKANPEDFNGQIQNYAKGGMMANGSEMGEDVSKSLYVAKLYDNDGNFMGYTIKDKYNVSGKYTLSFDEEKVKENLQELIENPSKLAYYRKNEYADGGMMADGGEVKDLNYNDIFDVLKDKIDETVTSEISSPFENVNNYEGEEVESNSRDGFIAFTDGGYEARWFEYLSSFYSSGSSLPTKALDDEKERQINYNLTSAKESFIEEYPEIVEELGEENIDYNSLYEAGYENEAEQLSESETADMDTIMCEIGAYYYTPENSRGIDDKHTVRLFGLINLESPYHRSGNLEDRFDVDITFNSISELEKKVDKGLKEIIDWYAGSMFNESTKELKIVRMADGGKTEDFYEQLAVYVQGKGEIYRGTSMKKALEKANDYLAKNPKAEIVVVDDKYGDEYDLNGNLKDEYAKGGVLKEGDYVWNALGKKLVVNKVSDDEYFLYAFGQIGDSPFSKEKVEMYLKNGQWSRKPKMAKGGKISRNKNKNDFKGMFDFFLENNDQPIGKRDLINMAYESSNGVDSAIPQSMVGDVDNTAFYVYDYQTDKMGELVDLRMKLKFSNVKVDVTVVQDGELKYGNDLPYELENATFHQALNYVFTHDDIEQFSIRPRKKYAKGGKISYREAGENYEYVNTFGIEQRDFEKIVDAYHKSPSSDQIDRIDSRMTFNEMRTKYGAEKVDEVGNYIHKTHQSHGKMAKGGETDDGGYKLKDIKGLLIEDKPKNKWEYTDKDEIEYVVVKDKNGKELKFDGKYVISGVHDLLEKGGKLTEIGKYFSKNDVVSVVVNGKNILDKNTVSGVWIDKDAKPMAEDVADMKIGQTFVRKGSNGWKAKTMVDNFKGYDWDITTIKNSRGDLTTTAQGGKSENKGGYKMFSFMLYQDPSVRLQTSRPARVNEKVVSEQHAEALKVFEEKVGNTPAKEKMADGGAIGFDALAKKVADNYEGDNVKKEFQDEYGKTYDKKEAEEVGKKVAGKVYRQQQAKGKMAKGGKVAKKTGSNFNRSESKMTIISRKASEIRKANEPWRDAFNRAKAMLYS